MVPFRSSTVEHRAREEDGTEGEVELRRGSHNRLEQS